MNYGIYKRQRIPKVQYKMNNPGKMATLSKQDEEKQNTNTRQYVLDTNIHKKPTNKINKT